MATLNNSEVPQALSSQVVTSVLVSGNKKATFRGRRTVQAEHQTYYNMEQSL